MSTKIFTYLVTFLKIYYSLFYNFTKILYNLRRESIRLTRRRISLNKSLLCNLHELKVNSELSVTPFGFH